MDPSHRGCLAPGEPFGGSREGSLSARPRGIADTESGDVWTTMSWVIGQSWVVTERQAHLYAGVRQSGEPKSQMWFGSQGATWCGRLGQRSLGMGRGRGETTGTPPAAQWPLQWLADHEAALKLTELLFFPFHTYRHVFFAFYLPISENGSIIYPVAQI